MTNKAKKDDLSFEAALAELEGIVTDMEQGDLPLEQALQKFERGIQLTHISQQKLQQAQQKVQILMQQQGEASLVPFEPDQD